MSHLAVRPSWNCASCGQPWPCPEARTTLTVEYARSPTALRFYLAACLYEAIEDSTTHRGSATDLFDRFLRWS